MTSWDEYLCLAVRKLLRPGARVEMHDLPGLDYYNAQNELVSRDWVWKHAYETKWAELGMDGPAGFAPTTLRLQKQDFDEIGSKMYKLPCAPVAGRPETGPWARHAVTGLILGITGAVIRFWPDDEKKQEKMTKSCWATAGVAEEGRWLPFLVVWAKKPESDEDFPAGR